MAKKATAPATITLKASGGGPVRGTRAVEEERGGYSDRSGQPDHQAPEEGRAGPYRRPRHFAVRKRAARMGRNPATGEQIQIKASKKVAFRAAKELKEAV